MRSIHQLQPDAGSDSGEPGRDLRGIEALRAVAALLVVVHHALEESNGANTRFSPDWLTTAGAAGVDVFFVISGLIMYFTCFGRGTPPPTTGQFLLRRARRIFPLYWLCCAGMLLAAVLGFRHSFRISFGDAVYSLLLLPSQTGIIDVSWTLVFELYFYVLFGLSLILRDRVASIAATILAISAFCLLAPQFVQGPWREHFANPISFEFCAGLGLGYLFENGRVRVPAWILPFAIAAFAIAAVLVEPPSTARLPMPTRLFAWGVPAVIMVAAALRMKLPGGAIGRAAVGLGAASYALYLTHPFVMLGYAAVLKRSAVVSGLPQQPLVLAVVMLAVGVAWTVHAAVERPLDGRLKRLLAARPER